MPFEPKSFDAVFCMNNVAHAFYVSALKYGDFFVNAIRDIASTVKIGGYLAISQDTLAQNPLGVLLRRENQGFRISFKTGERLFETGQLIQPLLID